MRGNPRQGEYVLGADRNNPDEARAHWYLDIGDSVQELVPMCEYGWNRSSGFAFSILRGHGSRRGACQVCERRKARGNAPCNEPRGHKTRWI